MKTLTIIAFVLFVAHAIDEYVSGFYLIDATFRAIANASGTSSLFVFLVEQMVGAILFASAIYRPTTVLQIIIGMLLVFEFSHPLLALSSRVYAGVATGSLLALFSFMYWRKLLRTFRGTMNQ